MKTKDDGATTPGVGSALVGLSAPPPHPLIIEPKFREPPVASEAVTLAERLRSPT